MKLFPKILLFLRKSFLSGQTSLLKYSVGLSLCYSVGLRGKLIKTFKDVGMLHHLIIDPLVCKLCELLKQKGTQLWELLVP